MIHSEEDLFFGCFILVLFAPSVWGIFSILLNIFRNKVTWSSGNLVEGFFIHICNLLLSPGIPACLLYIDKNVGGGSVASLLSLPLIPVTWGIYFFARRKAFSSEPPSSK